MKRYKITKEQLERVVENFVMESATEKNMIPAQAPEAKKFVKNKMSGDMVDQSENMPSVTTGMKKKSQAPEAKKNITNKMAGKMVQKSSNAPSAGGMKKMSQAPETKKYMAKGTSYMTEQEILDEGIKEILIDIKNYFTGEKTEEFFFKQNQAFMASALRKGLVNEPTEEILDKIKESGKKDGFKGALKYNKNKEFIYVPQSELKGPGGMSGHAFGHGAGM